MNAITAAPSRAVSAEPVNPEVLEAVLMNGDLAKLPAQQRVEYMLGVCRTLGLNPATKPFEFITLNGKLVMYARRDCTEQLRKIHGVSITIKAREIISGVYVVTANAQDAKGRVDESTGAVPVEGVKGENLANAMMKAETKAKRRVTLSICGLGLLDESEVGSVVDHAQTMNQDQRNTAAASPNPMDIPMHDLEAKAEALRLWKILHPRNKALATEIKRQCGTDAALMAQKYREALDKEGVDHRPITPGEAADLDAAAAEVVITGTEG